STTIYVLIEGIEDLSFEGELSIYPNPSNGQFTIESVNGNLSGLLKIEILNMIGQELYAAETKIFTGAFKKELDLSPMPPGIYLVKFSLAASSEKTENTFATKKIIIF